MVWSSAISDTGVAEQGRPSALAPTKEDEMSSSDFISYDRPCLTALPAADLVGRLRQHADAEIHNKLRYIVRADKLMRAAADRISMLESELHRRA